MKVLFLDIDGVLNNLESMARAGTAGPFCFTVLCWDPKCVNELIRICEQTGCSLVISSVWRQDLEHVRNCLRSCCYGVDDYHKMHVIGRTPSSPGKRGQEINDWLLDNKNVREYVIIDDDDDMLETQKDRFVKTEVDTGLTPELADKAIDILGRLDEVQSNSAITRQNNSRD